MASLQYCISDDTFSAFRSQHLQLKTASADWERHQYYALRKQVFGEEQRLFLDNERDSADFRAIAILALCNNCSVADAVVGAVRIFQDIDDASGMTWFGGRLCVAQEYRRHRGLGTALVNAAVSHAKELGCRRFLANIQAANEAYFRRIHWQRLYELQVHGQPHVRMQAQLQAYPFLPHSLVSP